MRNNDGALRYSYEDCGSIGSLTERSMTLWTRSCWAGREQDFRKGIVQVFVLN